MNDSDKKCSSLCNPSLPSKLGNFKLPHSILFMFHEDIQRGFLIVSIENEFVTPLVTYSVTMVLNPLNFGFFG